MIRMLIFVILALASSAFAEECKDIGANYTTYAGDTDGQTIGKN